MISLYLPRYKTTSVHGTDEAPGWIIHPDKSCTKNQTEMVQKVKPRVKHEKWRGKSTRSSRGILERLPSPSDSIRNGIYDRQCTDGAAGLDWEAVPKGEKTQIWDLQSLWENEDLNLPEH